MPEENIISVPSVTLWSNDEEAAQEYLKGRKVVIIPDADCIDRSTPEDLTRLTLINLSKSENQEVAAYASNALKETG